MLSRGYIGVIWVRSDFNLQRKDLAFAMFMLLLLGLVGGYEWCRKI
jgi:hypothetical protein